MRNRGSSLFALASAVVAFGLVIALVFAGVTLLDRLQGPHVPSGWSYVEYSIDGELSEDQQNAVAKSIVFRMHLGRAADARWWVDDEAVTVAVPSRERAELEAVPADGPKMEFGGVVTSDKVGEGAVKSADACHSPPEQHACDRDRNVWYELEAPSLTGKDIAESKVVEDKAGTGAYAVQMTLVGDAKKELADTTTKMAESSDTDGSRLAIVYGGIVLSAAPVAEPLTKGVVRLPGFSKPEGLDLVAAVDASKFDVALHKGAVQTAE